MKKSIKKTLPQPLVKLKQIIYKGLESTEALFTPIKSAYELVHEAAEILENEDDLSADEVKQNYQNLIQKMSNKKHLLDNLQQGIEHFIKITISYWTGLFHCYVIEDLPRTNNDLEQTFGVLRHHQRRCTGRKVAPSSLVIRGSVQLASAVATKVRSFTAEDLSQVSSSDLSDLRDDLKKHHNTRIEQFQFRRNPSEYLASLESMLL